MHEQRRQRLKRSYCKWPAVTALALLALLLPAAAEGNQKSRRERYRLAKQEFAQANRLRSELEAKPESKRPKKSYAKVAQTYRRVYDIAPFSALAADALAARAEVYHDMGNLFGPDYWKKSIAVYEFLRREYPKSRYRDTALYKIAETYHVHLRNSDAALETYRRFLKSYPKSKLAGDAKNALRKLASRREARRARQESPPRAIPASGSTMQQPAVRPKGERAVVQNIRYWNSKGYTRVVVDLDRDFVYQEARLSNPDRIFFDLFNTQMAAALSGKEIPVQEGLLHRIRVAENRSGVTRVVLEVNDVKDYSVFTLPNPFRLVIDIRSSGGAPGDTQLAAAEPGSSTPAPVTKPAQPTPAEIACAERFASVTQAKPASNGQHTLTRALGLKVSRIVLDPGHGGNDHGTTGPSGLKEKDLVLDVAKRLAKRLKEELCAEVILTRSSDRFVPLESRTGIANQKQADLFISIHANYSRSRKIRGIETYYLNFTNDPEALAVATRENALSQSSMHDLQDIIRKISRNEKLSESRELAADLQGHLARRLKRYSKRIRNRGVKKAPFVVLIGANMPSVLTEISFISNRSDETHLKTRQGRGRVVEGLFNGITQYLKDINGLSVAQATD